MSEAGQGDGLSWAERAQHKVPPFMPSPPSFSSVTVLSQELQLVSASPNSVVGKWRVCVCVAQAGAQMVGEVPGSVSDAVTPGPWPVGVAVSLQVSSVLRPCPTKKSGHSSKPL